MMARTEKGKEIRKYYMKIEKIFQNVRDEEHIENKKVLMLKDIETTKLLEMKNLEIEAVKAKLKYQQPVSILYIGHNPVIEHLHKIGITDDALVRQESHRSSNPQFKYLFTFETEHASKIESVIKLLLKPFKVVKPEWYSVNYYQIKKVVDFGIMMYENYAINDSIDNLVEFISRYRSNRLVNVNKARILIERDVYSEFVSECVTTGPRLKVSTNMLCTDFYDWYSKKFPNNNNHIKLETGNWSTVFQSELTKNIASITGLEYLESSANGVALHDKKRGIFFSKSSGFKGMELKSMNSKTGYFDKIVYEQYVDKFITVTNNPRHKVARVEVVEDFVAWVRNTNVTCKTPLFQKSQISNTFKDVLIKAISDITGLQLQEVCKLTYRGCFVGMTHSKFPFIGNESPQKPISTDLDVVKKQIDIWMVGTSKIANLFRVLNNSDNKKLDVSQVRHIMKTTNLTLNKKKRSINSIFARDKTHYFFTEGALQYIDTLA
jgi:T5orf172 domain